MKDESLPTLIAAIDAAARGIVNAVRSVAKALGSEAPAAPAPRSAAPFGEYGRLEESKYFPPAPSPAGKLGDGELPRSYGKTRLGLLVVDTNLVHAYWEVQPEQLREAMARTGGAGQAVLRFHEPAGSFDVEVDLDPGNWYVPLWSADRAYYVDLGVRAAGGSFVQLARSNAIVTPRAMPAMEPVESFMRVSPNGRDTEIVEPPPYRKPQPPRMPLPPAASAVPAVNPGHPPGAAPTTTPSRGIEPPAVAAGVAAPIDATAILQKKLAELYALREWRPEPSKPPEPVRETGNRSPEAAHADLTELAEKHEITGISSALLQQRRPEP